MDGVQSARRVGLYVYPDRPRATPPRLIGPSVALDRADGNCTPRRSVRFAQRRMIDGAARASVGLRRLGLWAEFARLSRTPGATSPRGDLRGLAVGPVAFGATSPPVELRGVVQLLALLALLRLVPHRHRCQIDCSIISGLWNRISSPYFLRER
jgi:hypothetical protein